MAQAYTKQMAALDVLSQTSLKAVHKFEFCFGIFTALVLFMQQLRTPGWIRSYRLMMTTVRQSLTDLGEFRQWFRRVMQTSPSELISAVRQSAATV